MTLSMLGLLVSFLPQASAPVAGRTFVVSIINERTGDDVFLRFVLSGPPRSYSATREGDDILVRIEAEALPALSIPASRDPVRSLVLGPGPGFSVRVTLAGADLSKTRPTDVCSTTVSPSRDSSRTVT